MTGKPCPTPISASPIIAVVRFSRRRDSIAATNTPARPAGAATRPSGNSCLPKQLPEVGVGVAASGPRRRRRETKKIRQVMKSHLNDELRNTSASSTGKLAEAGALAGRRLR